MYKKQGMTPVITAVPSVPRPKIKCVGTVRVHGMRYRAALIGIEWVRFAAY